MRIFVGLVFIVAIISTHSCGNAGGIGGGDGSGGGGSGDGTGHPAVDIVGQWEGVYTVSKAGSLTEYQAVLSFSKDGQMGIILTDKNNAMVVGNYQSGQL